MTLDECEAIFEKVRSAVSESALCAEYQALLAVYPVLHIEPKVDTFWRGRKCESDQPYMKICALAYPSPARCKVNRLNSEGKPCLYAATAIETIFSELRLQPNDLVHVIGIRPTPSEEISYFMIGELYQLYKTGYLRITGGDPNISLENVLLRYNPCLDREDMKRIVFIDKFFATILADPKAHESNYLLTRCLASEVSRKVPQAGGFFYPSVQDNAGMCLALTPTTYDRKMRIVCSKVIRISRVRPFGFYDHEVCLEATGIKGSGEFIWRKPLSNRSEHYFNLTEEEAEEMKERNSKSPFRLNRT